MAFDWGNDVNQATEDAINRLPDYNSSNFNPGTNPQGLAGGGHITNFPAALADTAAAANGFAVFADLMEAYANASQASAVAAAAAVANLSGTSTSSVAISTGVKSFATQADKTWPAGSYLLISSDANPTTYWMVLQVTSYSGTALQGTCILFSGSGSRADWTIRATGVPGRQGGLAYIWSTSTTAADPTSGKLKFNATPGSATALYISETDYDGNSLGSLMATWDDSSSTIKGRLTVRSITQPANFAIIDLNSSLTDNGTWDSFSCVSVANGGTLADGMQVNVIFVPNGNPGDTGSSGPSYAATSTTSLAIGTGTKVFTTQAGLAYLTGTRARATDAANTANWMEGVVNPYSGTSLTLIVDLTSGSGTIANWNVSVAGERGVTGTTGASGDDAGFEFQFNSAVASDPGTGKFLFNNATFASATAWHVSETDNNGLNIRSLLDAIDNGTGANKILVFVIKQGGAAYFSFYVTSTLTDAGAYDTFNITPISTGGTIANNDTFHVITIPLEPGATGATGAAGPTTSPVWTFDSGTTAVDPGTNEFALNNATIASVTALYINETGIGSADVSAYLASWDDSTNSTHRGTLYIIQTTDPAKYAIFTTGTVTDNGTYDSVALTYVSGPGGFTAGQACAFSFFRSGNAGAGAGDVVGPASATNMALALWDGATGKLLRNSAVDQLSGQLSPITTDTVALGSTTKMWSDFYLASGAVINYNNGNATITHSSGVINVTVGDFQVTTAGTNASSVVTVGGTQTLTSKTLTSPVINTPTGIVKGDVGLGNVDNTSDANKPISTAERAALDIRSDVRVRAAATTNITIATALNNADSLDGVTLATGDLVLVAGQSSAGENGIYVVGTSPARHTEYATFNAYPGAWVLVQEGSTNADTTWLCTANTGGTIGTTPLTFVQHGGPSGAGGRAILVAADATAAQSAIGLTIGSNTQAYDALLTAIAGLAMVADRYIYGTGTDTVTLGTITTAGRAILDDAAATDQLTTLGFSTYGKTLIDDADASAALTTLGVSTFAKTILDDTTAAAVLTTIGAVGKQAIPVPAGALDPAVTNGPSSGTVTGTNTKFSTKDFDTTTQETAYFAFRMPQQWDEGTLTFQVEWSHPATTTNFGVAWGLSAVAVGDAEAGDAAFGTEIIVTDTGGTTNSLYITAESAAMTAAGTIAAGDYVFFRLRRVPANGSDTLAVDARAHECTVYMNNNAGNDT